MARRDQSAQAARPGYTSVDSGVNTGFVKTPRQKSGKLTERSNRPNEAIPNITIHPVAQLCQGSGQTDNRTVIQLIEPELVLQKTKKAGLRRFHRVGLASVAIQQDSEANSAGNKHER